MTTNKTILTHDTIDKLAAWVEKGQFANTACDLEGVSKSTYERWLRMGRGALKSETPFTENEKMYVALVQRMAKARASGEARNVLRLQIAAKSDPKWAAWILERQSFNNWGNKSKVISEVTADVVSADPKLVGWLKSNMTKEQLMAYKKFEEEGDE